MGGASIDWMQAAEAEQVGEGRRADHQKQTSLKPLR
jgi:hypothetical protein